MAASLPNRMGSLRANVIRLGLHLNQRKFLDGMTSPPLRGVRTLVKEASSFLEGPSVRGGVSWNLEVYAPPRIRGGST